MDLSSLPTMLLSTSPSMGSPKILFTVVAFHTALLLTRELISQLMRCISGLCSWKSLVLPGSPSF